EEVRADLEKQLGTSITLEKLTLADETQLGPGRRYRLRTTEENVDEVRRRVAAAFPNRELLKVTMSTGEIQPIPKDDASDGSKKRTGFEGGHQVTLKFSHELTVAVVTDQIEKKLRALGDKYPEPEALIEVTGTAGSGLTAGERTVKKFSEMLLQARPEVAPEDLETVLSAIQAEMAETPLFEEVNKFAKAVGTEMQEAALLAILFSLIAIIGYIWYRFQRVTFGLAAVIALVHDVVAAVGLVAMASFLADTTIGNWLALVDFKINLPMIAAFLTIIGYSLNDTIVVFDRIREVRGKNPALTPEMVNTSVNQTLSRTLLTSLTTLIVVTILYFLGGEGIHGFAFCLVIGVIVGTYSSIYIASPSLLWLMNRPGSDSAQATTRAKRAATV
ncbi:MAG TPA: protein translocase subunit SecF, partial [Planctomycetaceae bacterium]|nr:protein translocase subunit SecF [Planctomycetaceae bacterium]